MKCEMGDFVLTDETSDVDVDFVESMLRTTYWAAERSREKIEGSVEKSINFSVYEGERQIAYARVVSDSHCFAWIADVIVDPEYRRRGIGRWMMECIMDHPDVRETTLQLLRTRDAHPLYSPFGFDTDDCMTRRPGK